MLGNSTFSVSEASSFTRHYYIYFLSFADLIDGYLLAQATVDVISASGNIFGFIAGKEYSHRSDFFWSAKASPRNFANSVLHRRGIVKHHLIDRRGDRPWSNVVDVDLVLSQFHGQIAH